MPSRTPVRRRARPAADRAQRTRPLCSTAAVIHDHRLPQVHTASLVAPRGRVAARVRRDLALRAAGLARRAAVSPLPRARLLAVHDADRRERAHVGTRPRLHAAPDGRGGARRGHRRRPRRRRADVQRRRGDHRRVVHAEHPARDRRRARREADRREAGDRVRRSADAGAPAAARKRHAARGDHPRRRPGRSGHRRVGIEDDARPGEAARTDPARARRAAVPPRDVAVAHAAIARGVRQRRAHADSRGVAVAPHRPQTPAVAAAESRLAGSVDEAFYDYGAAAYYWWKGWTR